jgi:hypothetical protein
MWLESIISKPPVMKQKGTLRIQRNVPGLP